MSVMGRYLFPILFVIVLLSPFVLRLAIGGEEEDPVVEASGQTQRLVIVTPHNRDILVEFERAFRPWHVEKYGYDVDLDYRNVGGTVDIVKSLADFYGSVKNRNNDTLPPIDEITGVPYHMVWGGGDYVFNVELEGVNALQGVEMPSEVMAAAYPQAQLAGINLYDQDDPEDGVEWFGVCLSSFGIVYSPFLYERLELEPPTTWSDLARPELNDLLVLADPGKSGSAAVAYVMVLQRAMADAEEAFLAGGGSKESPEYMAALEEGWVKGMGDLLLIAANARYFTDSASAVPTDVSHANAAAGTAIDFYGRVEEEIVGSDRIRYIVPPAATAVTPDPIAVCYGTTGDDLENAKHFIEFLLTPQGQRLWIKEAGSEGGPRNRALRRTPIRKDVFADQTSWTDKNNPFEESADFNQRQEWMDEFSETRAVWQAAWIEAGESLDAAYKAILELPEGENSSDLLNRLRNTPVEWRLPDGESGYGANVTGWQAVKALRADRRRQPENERAAFLPAARLTLAEQFRQHFDKLRDEARGD